MASKYPYQKPAQALNKLGWDITSSNDKLPRLSKAGPILQLLSNVIPQVPRISKRVISTETQHPQSTTPQAQHASLNLELVPSHRALVAGLAHYPKHTPQALSPCLVYRRANAAFPSGHLFPPYNASMHLV